MAIVARRTVGCRTLGAAIVVVPVRATRQSPGPNRCQDGCRAQPPARALGQILIHLPLDDARRLMAKEATRKKPTPKKATPKGHRAATNRADRVKGHERSAGSTKRARSKGAAAPEPAVDAGISVSEPLRNKAYLAELGRLQVELVKLQEWIRQQGLKIVVLFEGRDAAGKGGVIKTITQSLNPRVCRVVALAAPTERERTQWYFQRYVSQLPAAGEMTLFDRSWYNRAGVERVMGFCSDDKYREFIRSCPEFERMLIRSGIILVKYWFSVSDAEQERRFQARISDPTKRWKLSPMDLQSRSRWLDYSKAKDEMFAHCDIKQAPWYVVNADDKKRARLNCITHLLSVIPYEDLTPELMELPPRQSNTGYVRPPLTDQTFVPEVY
jgi:polyphosphate kinase 2